MNAKTIQMDIKLGEILGKVCEAIFYEMMDKSTMIKVKVKINIVNHIKIDMYIGSYNNVVTWIDFRYERLPMFSSNMKSRGIMNNTTKTTLSLSMASLKSTICFHG